MKTLRDIFVGIFGGIAVLVFLAWATGNGALILEYAYFNEGGVFNETGIDSDFRVEGNTDNDLLFVDASTDRVGISTNAPNKTLDVQGDINLSGALTCDTTIDATTTMSAGTGLTVTTGDALVSAGNFVATLGNLDVATTVTAGTDVIATAGSVSANTTVTAGTDLIATAGDVTAGDDVIATDDVSCVDVAASGLVTGGTGVTATTNDVTADAGNIVATLGSVSAATTCTCGTDVTATTGDVTAGDDVICVDVAASGNVVGGTGVTATTGNVTASAGSVDANTSVSAGTTVTAATDVTATAGDVTAGDDVFDVLGELRMIYPVVSAADPDEPFDCTAAVLGWRIIVDDTNDGTNQVVCVCLGVDDVINYEWQRNDDNSTICPSLP